MRHSDPKLAALLGICCVLFITCNGIFGGGETLDELLSFDLLNADAVAAVQSASGPIGSVGSRSGDDWYTLARVMSDGSSQLAAEFTEDMVLPPVRFVEVSPNSRDIFVSLSESFMVADVEVPDTHGNIDVLVLPFLHVRPDGSCVDVLGKVSNDEHLRIMDWGSEVPEYRHPIAFDTAGRVYFAYESGDAADAVRVVCRYDPIAETVTEITPATGSYQFSRFTVSPDGQYLFVVGNSGYTSFFRMYPVDNPADMRTIYQTTDSNVRINDIWVAPDSNCLVTNAQNVDGLSGIIRISGFDSDEFVYECLYEGSPGGGPINYGRTTEADGTITTYGTFYLARPTYGLYVVVTNGTDVAYAQLSTLTSATDNAVTTYSDQFYGVSYRTLGSGGSPYYLATSPADLTVHSSATNLGELGAEHAVMVFRYDRYDYPDEVHELTTLRTATSDAILADVGSYDAEYYIWANHLYTGDDVNASTLDEDLLTRRFAGQFIQDVEFAHGGLTGSGAYAASLADDPFTTAEIYGPTGDDASYFIRNHFVVEGTTTPATTIEQYKAANDLDWFSFQSVGSFMEDSDGVLWAGLGGSGWYAMSHAPAPIRILDASGQKDLFMGTSLRGDDYLPTGFVVDGMTMYFRDIVRDAGGLETTWHRLFGLDLSAADPVPVDLLANVPENAELTIEQFSAGGGNLYFSAWQASTAVHGVIDLATLEYSPIQSPYVLPIIEAY